MEKSDRFGVQALSVKGKRLPGRTVNGISEQRMLDARHMDADLMRSSRFQTTFDIRT